MDDVKVLGNIFDKVSFVNNVPLLMKATSEDERPTPGYMFEDISKLTYESANVCEVLIEFLTHRFSCNSAQIKVKVLKIMKYVIVKGHEDFKHELRKNNSLFCDAAKYTGPKHLLEGNTPHLKVRDIAKEISQLLFEVDSKHCDSSSVGGHYIGLGTTTLNSNNSTGFGNTPTVTQNKSFSGSFLSSLRDLTNKMIDTKYEKCVLNAVPKTTSLVGKYEPPPCLIEATNTIINEEMILSKEPTQSNIPHRPGFAGGGWDDNISEVILDSKSVNHNYEMDSPYKMLDELDKSKTSVIPDSPDDDRNIEMLLIQNFVKADIPFNRKILREITDVKKYDHQFIVNYIIDVMNVEDVQQFNKCLLLLEQYLINGYVPVNTLKTLFSPITKIISPNHLCINKVNKIVCILEKYDLVIHDTQ